MRRADHGRASSRPPSVHGPSLETVAIALAYVAGAIVPLAIIAGWGRRASQALGGSCKAGGSAADWAVAMLVTAVLIVTGLDFTLERAGRRRQLPAGWGGALLAVEQQPNIQKELDVLRTTRSTPPAAEGCSGTPQPVHPARPISQRRVGGFIAGEVALEDLGPAPELTGIDAWINSDPLTIASLRGKVVLVEFWTFGCINCSTSSRT